MLFAGEVECEINTRTAGNFRTVCTCFMRAVDASRNKPLVPAWEAEALKSKRGTREDRLCQGVRLFRAREPLVSRAGTFAWIRLFRSFHVFLVGHVREGQLSYHLREAAG